MKFISKRLLPIIILGISVVVLLSLYYLKLGTDLNLGFSDLLDNGLLLPLKEILQNPWMIPIVATPFIVIIASKYDKKSKSNTSNGNQDPSQE